VHSAIWAHGMGRTALFAIMICLPLGACAVPVQQTESQAPLPQPEGWKALLIAGDDAEPAFDNGVDAMAGKLESFGVPAANISILKASAAGAEAATQDNIIRDFSDLDPAAGEGCFVFITSHGAPNKGLVVRSANAFLNPVDLDSFLNRSCGRNPTVVIASGCFSGIFAEGQSMPTPNRLILTAARDDRPSFGCNAKRQLTIFDKCVLGNLDPGLRWQAAMDRIRACVAANVQALGIEAASSPRISVGEAVADLKVF
jgi:hypothetical protein